MHSSASAMSANSGTLRQRHRVVVIGGGFGGLQATPADPAPVRAMLAAAGQPSATRTTAEAPVR